MMKLFKNERYFLTNIKISKQAKRALFLRRVSFLYLIVSTHLTSVHTSISTVPTRKKTITEDLPQTQYLKTNYET